MKLIRGISHISRFQNAVVALGMFDGVHRAHQKILSACVRQAKDTKGTSVVVTFWPHPQKKPVLYSLEHRLRLFARLGIGVCVVITFNKKFASLSADDFIRQVLVKKVKARYVFIGKNFRFGRSAAGDYQTLRRYAQQYHYRVRVFEVMKSAGVAISSTSIRRFISAGKLSCAQKLLLRPVSVLGTVIKGRSLAAKLGFPTANINPHHEVLPPAGVYAARVALGRKVLPGICYIGSRPTLEGTTRRRQKNIEVHIFDFHGKIYGRDLQIEFLKKIRKEKKFPTLSVLAGQIRADARFARPVSSPH
jgi:riboflavin kinase/FMN adenylyltransferase